MNCNKCGAEMDENAKFCTECGARFDSEPEPEKADAEAQETAEQIISADVSPETNSNEAAETIEEAESQPSAEPVPEEKTAEEVPVNTAVINDESSRFPVGNDNTNSESVRENFEQTIDTPAVERAKLSGGRVAGAVVISLFAFVFLMILNVFLTARIGFGSAAVKKSSSSVKAEILLDSKLKGDETLSEYVYNNMETAFINKGDSKVKDVRSFIINSGIFDYASSAASDYAAYLVDGSLTKDPTVSCADIVDYLREQDSVFEDEFGYRMKDKDYTDLEASLEKEGIDSALSIDEWSDKTGFGMNNLHFAFSFITIGIIFAIVLVLYIWMAIVLDKHTKKIMGFMRFITFVCGIIIFVPSVVFLIGSPICAAVTDSAIVYLASKVLVPAAAAGSAIGFIELIIAFIFKCIRKAALKKEKKLNGVY